MALDPRFCGRAYTPERQWFDPTMQAKDWQRAPLAICVATNVYASRASIQQYGSAVTMRLNAWGHTIKTKKQRSTVMLKAGPRQGTSTVIHEVIDR